MQTITQEQGRDGGVGGGPGAREGWRARSARCTTRLLISLTIVLLLLGDATGQLQPCCFQHSPMPRTVPPAVRLCVPSCATCSRAGHLNPVLHCPRCLACCSRSLQVQYAALGTTTGGSHGPLYLGESNSARCRHAGGGYASCCWLHKVFFLCAECVS